jgi:hypothetical protein
MSIVNLIILIYAKLLLFLRVFVFAQVMHHLHLLLSLQRAFKISILKLQIRQQDKTFRRRKRSISFALYILRSFYSQSNSIWIYKGTHEKKWRHDL